MRPPQLAVLLHVHLLVAAGGFSDAGTVRTTVGDGYASLAKAYVSKGQSRTVPCTTFPTLNGILNVTWTVDGRKLTPDGSGWRTEQGADGSLVVHVPSSGSCASNSRGCFELQSAVYQCVAQGEHGLALVGHPLRLIASATGNLSAVVHNATEEGHFSANVNQSAVTSTYLAIACHTHGVWVPPPNHYLWYRNGAVVPDSERVVSLPDGTLLISRPAADIAGTYRCKAMSVQQGVQVYPWKESTETELRVPSPDTAHVNEQREVHVLTPPPPQIVAAVGETVVIPCVALGPNGTFTTWCRKGQCSNNRSRCLRMDAVSELHSGAYECVVSHMPNLVQKLNATYLLVHGPPKLHGSQFEKKEALVTRHLRISCQVAPREASPLQLPYHVTWFKNGFPVQQSPSLKLSDSEHLLLSPVEPAHAGYYQCLAENSVGTSSRTFLINVLAPDTARLYPPVILSVVPTMCYEDSSLTIKCELHFNETKKIIALTIDYMSASQWSTRGHMNKVVTLPTHCLETCDDAAESPVAEADLSRTDLVASEGRRRCIRCEAEIEQLTAATTYTLRIMLFHARGAGEYSQLVNATTSTPLSSFPHLQLVALGSSAVLLNWSKPLPNASDDIRYTIFYLQKSGNDFPVVNRSVSGISRQYYLVTGLKQGDVYHFSVVKEPYRTLCSDQPWKSFVVPQSVSSALPLSTPYVTRHNSTTLLATWMDSSSHSEPAEYRLFYEIGNQQFGPYQHTGNGSQYIEVGSEEWCEITLISIWRSLTAVSSVRYDNGSACATAKPAADLSATWLNGSAAMFAWRAPPGCCTVQYSVAYRTKGGSAQFETTAPLACGKHSTIIQPLRLYAVYDWMVLTSQQGIVAPTVASAVAHYGHSKVPMPSNLTVAVLLLPDSHNSYGEFVTLELRWMAPLAGSSGRMDAFYFIVIKKADIDPENERSFNVTDTFLRLAHMEPGFRYFVSVYAATSDEDVSAPLKGTVRVPCPDPARCMKTKGPGEEGIRRPENRSGQSGLSEQQKGVLIGSLVAVSCILLTVAILVALKRALTRTSSSAAARTLIASRSRRSSCDPAVAQLTPTATSCVDAEDAYMTTVAWKELGDNSMPDSGIIEDTSSTRSIAV